MTCDHKPITDIETGEVVCISCGEVLDREMILSSQKYDTVPLADYNLGRANLGSWIKPGEKGLSKTSKIWHNRLTANSAEMERLKLMINMFDIAGLNKMQQNVIATKFNQLHKTKLKRKIIKHSIAALIYLYLRQEGIPKTLDEISKMYNITGNGVAKLVRLLSSEFKTENTYDAKSLVLRLSNMLQLTRSQQFKMLDLLEDKKFKDLTVGHAPSVIAGVIIKLVADECTLEKISKVCGVSTVSIRNLKRKLKEENFEWK